MSKFIKRSFWNVSRGKYSGYIESIHSQGFFIKNTDIYFRNTSSNLATGEVHNISVHNLIKNPRNKNILEQALIHKTPILIDVQVDLIGNPFIGAVIEPKYVTNITENDKEIIHTKTHLTS